MNSGTPHERQSLAGACALAGCWTLVDGRALTLRPTRPGVLRIAHGRVWATFGQARRDDGARGGDHFLVAGQELRLLPGQTLVMESWSAAPDTAACFSWDCLPAAARVAMRPRRAAVLADSAQWRTGVLQPLRDLRLAFGLAGTASARLLAGLAGTLAPAWRAVLPRFATDLIAGRARKDWAARAFKAHSSESRAHGPIN